VIQYKLFLNAHFPGVSENCIPLLQPVSYLYRQASFLHGNLATNYTAVSLLKSFMLNWLHACKISRTPLLDLPCENLSESVKKLCFIVAKKKKKKEKEKECTGFRRNSEFNTKLRTCVSPFKGSLLLCNYVRIFLCLICQSSCSWRSLNEKLLINK